MKRAGLWAGAKVLTVVLLASAYGYCAGYLLGWQGPLVAAPVASFLGLLAGRMFATDLRKAIERDVMNGGK